MKTVKKIPLFVGMLMVTGIPTSVAFQRPPNVKSALSKTAMPTVSTDSQTVLNYRDHIEDEGGLLNGLKPSMPEQLQNRLLKTGVQLNVVRNMATAQAGALMVASGFAATALAASGHPIDLNCIHWNGATDSFRPLFDFTHLNVWQCIQGILAATPMIYLSSQVEKSDKRDVSHVNFSTMSK
mmetsp:Transcript_3320/g.5430  ORF Transcript_3320/g.5430 Transcript_3320/m.5430 type:complete len:182 (+) Transcript_3320:2718-3263(+)